MFKSFIRRFGAYLGAAVAVIVSLPTFGAAQLTTYTLPPDPVSGGMSAIGNNVITWVTTSGVPILLALVALGIVLRLIIRIVKRGARAV